MKRIFRFATMGIATAAVLFISLPALSDDCLEIAYDVFEKQRRPAVCFMHDEHNEAAEIEECSVCHHVWEDGQLLEDESSEDTACIECHGDDGDPKQMEMMVRYHAQCRGCHLTVKKGPITCGECHRK